MRERENKLNWGRDEGRFILLGLFTTTLKKLGVGQNYLSNLEHFPDRMNFHKDTFCLVSECQDLTFLYLVRLYFRPILRLLDS